MDFPELGHEGVPPPRLRLFRARRRSRSRPRNAPQFGLLHARMPVFRHEEAPTLDKPGSNAVLKNKVAIGTAVGTGLGRGLGLGLGLGARAAFALGAANASRFVASPSLALLVMPGWGANCRASVGARVGAEKKVGPLAALVTDASASGQVVRVAQTLTETETAHDVIEAAVAAVKDVSTTRPPVYQSATCARRAHRAFFHIHHASEPR